MNLMPCKTLATFALILLKHSVNTKYSLLKVEEVERKDYSKTKVFHEPNYNGNNYLETSNKTNLGDFLMDGLQGLIHGPKKGHDITTCPELGTEKIKFQRMYNLEYNTQCWEDNQPVFSLSTRDGVKDLKIVTAKTDLTQLSLPADMKLRLDKLVIIVHGFMSSAEGWVGDMAASILQQDPAPNTAVITVDWSRGGVTYLCS